MNINHANKEIDKMIILIIEKFSRYIIILMKHFTASQHKLFFKFSKECIDKTINTQILGNRLQINTM